MKGEANSRGPLRRCLDLARAGNFPSVWSNTLAALVLSDDRGGRLPSAGIWALATAGATLAYAGGATWNDVCDTAFDKRLHPGRPIASGGISRGAGAAVGTAELLGGLILFRLGGGSAALAAALAGIVLLYDLVHKRWSGSVLLMAGCRALLALTVASLPGHSDRPALLAWIGGLFAYIVILSMIARHEYASGAPAPKLGRVVGLLLAFMPLVDAVALAATGAVLAAAACAAAVPLGRWAQRVAAST